MHDNSDNYQEIIATLYEGHYHLGVAALANSLVKANFKGLIYIGYKGQLPPWCDGLQSKGGRESMFVLTPDITLLFEKLTTPMHFGYYKPHFLQGTFEKFPAARHLFYFDPDIVVEAEWSFFSKWVEYGVALCLDNAFPFVHYNHPWRNEWRSLAAEHFKGNNQIDYFVNTGFLGIRRSDAEVLSRWITLTDLHEKRGGTVMSFLKDTKSSTKTDQDLFNAVLTVSPEFEYSVIGQEGMGFEHPAYLMTHAVTVGEKPWRKNFLSQLIRDGNKPDLMQRNFFQHCTYPIPVFSRSQSALKRLNLKLALILGRLIG